MTRQAIAKSPYCRQCGRKLKPVGDCPKKHNRDTCRNCPTCARVALCKNQCRRCARPSKTPQPLGYGYVPEKGDTFNAHLRQFPKLSYRQGNPHTCTHTTKAKHGHKTVITSDRQFTTEDWRFTRAT